MNVVNQMLKNVALYCPNTLSLLYPTILYPTVLALGMKLSSGIVTTPCVADCEIKVKSLKMTSIATYRRRLFINPIYTNTFQLSYTLSITLKMSTTLTII